VNPILDIRFRYSKNPFKFVIVSAVEGGVISSDGIEGKSYSSLISLASYDLLINYCYHNHYALEPVVALLIVIISLLI